MPKYLVDGTIHVKYKLPYTLNPILELNKRKTSDFKLLIDPSVKIK